MTFLAVQMAVAWETHSREWMPAFSQMAGRRWPPFPVLNFRTYMGRFSNEHPIFTLLARSGKSVAMLSISW